MFAAPSGGVSIRSNCSELRHKRCTLRRVARVLSAPLSTVGRVLKALGLCRLKNLQASEPVRRYQWANPGEVIHFYTKQLARFERFGHLITGDRRLVSSRGAGYEKAHVAIDVATRLGYVAVLPDEKQFKIVGFLLGAAALFDGKGITCRRVLSDNGSAYSARPWREACAAFDQANQQALHPKKLTAKRGDSSRPCWLNGAYCMDFQTSDQWNRW